MFDEALFDEMAFDAPTITETPNPQTGTWELIQTDRGWALLLTPFPEMPTEES